MYDTKIERLMPDMWIINANIWIGFNVLIGNFLQIFQKFRVKMSDYQNVNFYNIFKNY